MIASPLHKRELAWLASLAGAFAVFGLMFAYYMSFSDSEWSFVVFGRMLLTGEIRLFQEEIVGRRLPVPFYVLGLSQILVGPSLLAARVWSLAFGVAAVVLTFVVGRALGGRGAGLFAAAFLVTHAVVVGFFASAAYYAMSAVLLLTGVWLLTRWPAPAGRLAAMACFSLLSLTRAHLVPMVPFVLVYLLILAPDLRERAMLLLVTALPPVVFLVWHPDHIKILAYVTLLDRLVEPLGYRSLLVMGAEDMIPEGRWMPGLVWFVKRHFFWLLATAGLVVAWVVAARRRPDDAGAGPRLAGGTLFVAALAVYTLAAQFAMITIYPKVVAAWSATFAPLWAVVLGCAAAALLAPPAAPAVRAAVAILLAGVFLLSPTFARHAAMPRPLPPETTLTLLARDAATIGTVVPPGARVFLLGSPIPTYVAEVSPYVRQIFGVWTFVPSHDDFVVQRSGLWGPHQVEEWLGHDAPYAVVEPDRLRALRTIGSYTTLIDRIQVLLERHFSLVAIAGHPPWTPLLYVYAREAAPKSGPRSPGQP